ncbi:hypothetical protein SAMN05216233_107201 [Desulfoluna spongiiphila]|uniref:Uncharacterized protein n=1 Tax=Desulfoluna spongiiphila TaxID=419481 RepID=A0A1G5F7W5_9BACT|nr:hypothetical protein SAMN05216233_107201 [Desulfoluna spongiiphila]VVS94243.1 hypothetical protein DBB_38150 [Desulfoluna spongiiphila]
MEVIRVYTIGPMGLERESVVSVSVSGDRHFQLQNFKMSILVVGVSEDFCSVKGDAGVQEVNVQFPKMPM